MQTLWLKVWGSGVFICMCVYDSFAPSLLTHATNNWSANWTRELFHVSTCVPGQMTAAQHLKKKAAACNQDALSASNGLVLDLRARRHFRVQLQKGWGGGARGDKGAKLEDRRRCFSGKVAPGGFENRMLPFLIRKRGSCLKPGCLAALAANATRSLCNEIWVLVFWWALRNDEKQPAIPGWREFCN